MFPIRDDVMIHSGVSATNSSNALQSLSDFIILQTENGLSCSIAALFSRTFDNREYLPDFW